MRFHRSRTDPDVPLVLSFSDPTATSSVTPIHPVVSNTTPLITLGEIGLLDVLRELYGTVWIPPSVFAEYQRGRAGHTKQPDLQALSWVLVEPASLDPFVLPASLDAGERDAILLALAKRASRILLDERHARAVAARLHLHVTGSVGVLLAAKQTAIIPHVKPYLEQIVAQGRHISSRLYDQILKQAGE